MCDGGMLRRIMTIRGYLTWCSVPYYKTTRFTYVQKLVNMRK